MRVGVYQYDEKVSPSLACDRAKLACDQAKKQPEHSWCLYTSAMQEKEELKQYLIDHLDEAIEKALPAGLLPTSHPDFDRPPLRGGSLDPLD
ncbi:hypothetical protein [Lactobacillus delbrueckii]|uniref:hypothetical protein n=1 Tax=Lactobacillus delbrueckii TaxID=1584 RepID=UPI0020BE5B62|nr:hypothetical protein [Lactobacillus delbrueckii]